MAVLHCSYGIYHMARRAGGRTPASSAAYQVFAGVSDACLLPIYAFGVFVARTQGSAWSSRLSDPGLLQYFLPAAEYTALGCGVLHVLTLFLSIWLGVLFRKIALMPPDLNPLEDRFTTRAKHKRNKSSIATTATQDSEKRLSTPFSDRRQPGMHFEDVSRPPTIPFLRTRTNSGASHLSRDSRVDLPSRQYQIIPANASPRNSVISTEHTGRRSMAPTPFNRNSYAAVPSSGDGDAPESAQDLARGGETQHQIAAESPRRAPKFTETWCATDSLISRTQHRNRMMQAAEERQRNGRYEAYEAVGGRYDSHEDASGSEVEDGALHPQPLRSHPTRTEGWYSTPRASRARPGSTANDGGFFSKPYGQLKPATPPVVVGNGRQVSSGNDFAQHGVSNMGRRNVSGKVVEEGRAGGHGYQRYSAFT